MISSILASRLFWALIREDRLDNPLPESPQRPTAIEGATTSPLISASGPTSTGPRLVMLPLILPRTINPPQTTRSLTTFPFFSTVTTPQVSIARRA